MDIFWILIDPMHNFPICKLDKFSKYFYLVFSIGLRILKASELGVEILDLLEIAILFTIFVKLI